MTTQVRYCRPTSELKFQRKLNRARPTDLIERFQASVSDRRFQVNWTGSKDCTRKATLGKFQKDTSLDLKYSSQVKVSALMVWMSDHLYQRKEI